MSGINCAVNGGTIDCDVWQSYEQNRDVKTRNHIFERYYYIVEIAAVRTANRTGWAFGDIDDLKSCGALALLNVIDRFDYTMGVQFDTYAAARVHGAMLDYLRKQDSVPRTVRKSINDTESARNALYDELGRSPTDVETAAKLNMSLGEYYRVQAKNLYADILSLDEFVGTHGGDAGKFDLSIPMRAAPYVSPEAAYEQKELEAEFARALASLNESARSVLILHYYMGVKQKHIAAVMGVSEARVSQIHSYALSKMKFKIEKYINC